MEDETDRFMDLDDEIDFEMVPRDGKRHTVLVIYDIVDNKLRNKMVKCLERFGIRVQKSAFEAYIAQKDYLRMLNMITKFIDPAVDSLRVYVLHSHNSIKSWGLGDKHVEDVIIF